MKILSFLALFKAILSLFKVMFSTSIALNDSHQGHELKLGLTPEAESFP